MLSWSTISGSNTLISLLVTWNQIHDFVIYCLLTVKYKLTFHVKANLRTLACENQLDFLDISKWRCTVTMEMNFIYVKLEFKCHHSSLGILFSVITVHCWVLYIYSSCHVVLVVPYFVDAPIAVQNCSSVVSFLNDLVCMDHWFFFNTLSKSWFFSTGACIYIWVLVN